MAGRLEVADFHRAENVTALADHAALLQRISDVLYAWASMVTGTRFGSIWIRAHFWSTSILENSAACLEGSTP